MKLKKVIINNYKSFGEKENLLFTDKLNAVIGKNESGKSNIIDALANIEMIGMTGKNYFICKNRKSNKEIKTILEFETYENEVTYYGFKGNAIVELDSYGNYVLSGDLSDFIANNKDYNEILNEIDELKNIGNVLSQVDLRNRFNKLIADLKMASTKIFIDDSSYKSIIRTFKQNQKESIVRLAELLENAMEFLDGVYTCFPRFVKVENEVLKTKYNIQNINESDILKKFLEICNIDIDNLKEKINSVDTADIINYEKDINASITENFTNKFNTFYNQEKIELHISINNKELNILVNTTGRYLDYDERSNGLKWYISVFIQLQYMESRNCESVKNNIILMDEPGVYLHPNAQKEVVNLFCELIKRENQIIYTTHSPFMLDTNALQNVRAVIKDEDGFTHIHNKITTIPNSSNSKYDTITPLINAIGLKLSYNIGPSFDKRNIIVEGITDYFYFQSYFKCKNEDEKPNIIPSTGADNIPAIASILFGWNCDFNIVLDQDDKGRSVYDSINDSKQLFAENIIFVDGNTIKISDKIFMIEDLLSENDKIKFGITQTDYNDNKYNYSYDTYNKILSEQEAYDSETMQKFEQLLKKLNLCNEK